MIMKDFFLIAVAVTTTPAWATESDYYGDEAIRNIAEMHRTYFYPVAIIFVVAILMLVSSCGNEINNCRVNGKASSGGSAAASSV